MIERGAASRRRGALLGLLLGALACADAPPTVGVAVFPGAGTAGLGELARLQVLVLGCADGSSVAKEELGAGAKGPFTLDAALPPGQAFAVWVRGWVACDGPCVPEEGAGPGACVCVNTAGQPSTQRLASEGCSEWLVAPEDLALRVTLTAPAGLCPPRSPEGGCPVP
jgi:hypothetical protein